MSQEVWTSQLKMDITFDPDIRLEPTSTQNNWLNDISLNIISQIMISHWIYNRS